MRRMIPQDVEESGPIYAFASRWVDQTVDKAFIKKKGLKAVWLVVEKLVLFVLRSLGSHDVERS